MSTGKTQGLAGLPARTGRPTQAIIQQLPPPARPEPTAIKAAVREQAPGCRQFIERAHLPPAGAVAEGMAVVTEANTKDRVPDVG